MMALSLHQPWATFVELGWKRLETRSWGTQYRGPLAIHAAKTRAHVLEAGDLARRAGFDVEYGRAVWKGFPLGRIVALCDLTDCFQVGVVFGRQVIAPADLILGDLSHGRHAWVLENVRALREPVTCRGRQGLWSLDEETAQRVVAQS